MLRLAVNAYERQMKRIPEGNSASKRAKTRTDYSSVELLGEDDELPCVMLEQRNPGLTDGLVEFKKIGHKYYFPWESEEEAARLPAIISCTTFIDLHAGKFAREEIAAKKAANGGYAESEGEGKTTEQILKLWEYWADKGTSTHYLFHAYFNRMPHQKNTWVKRLLKRFLADHPDLEIYWSERLLADVGLRLGGSADALFRIKSRPGWFYIVDWKTCRKILRHGIDDCFKVDGKCQPKPGQVCKRYFEHPAVAHLEKCNFNKYAIQLSLYRYLFETTEKLQIAGQALVVVNDNLLDYDMHETPYLRQEIESMFEEREMLMLG